MKYGFMVLLLVLALPACCLRKTRKNEAPEMTIEEEPMMQDDAMYTDTMPMMQDEMTQSTGE